MNIGDIFPNFQADTSAGPVDFYDWLGDNWGILFSHPADFTPVCTTELSRVAQLVPEFRRRGVQPIAVSCDSAASHREWIRDIRAYAGRVAGGGGGGGGGGGDAVELPAEFPYPIIDDAGRELAVRLNMLDRDEIGAAGVPLTCRAVFVVDGGRKLRLSLLYPASTGRNFDEILRAIDAMQLTDKNKVATPADWKHGEACMVLPTIKDSELPALFPQGVETVDLPSGKGYLRMTTLPK